MDWRLIVGIVWGGGTVLVYGRLLAHRWQVNRERHDRRSRRDVMAAVALFFTAVLAGIAAALFLADPRDRDGHAFAAALALGGFMAAGIVMTTTEKAR